MPPTRRVIGERKPYEPARSSQPAASNRLNASASMPGPRAAVGEDGDDNAPPPATG